METVEEIWADDLFDRRCEASDLIGYLESVAGRPSIREDSHTHVMAIDTAYGHGKTFFLKRLDRHLKATEHVSAYVDAWADDLEDQPMVALAATLDKALEPWAATSDTVANSLAEFKDKAGRVAKIVSIGLAKRGAGFLITQASADALGDELAKASETSRSVTEDALKKAGTGTVDDVTKAFEPVVSSDMEARIQRFRDGQAAIQAMKDSLSEVVRELSDAGMKLPITIIVDELDRCRPTYAIKVLEEIKHLFDVSGVAFLLGVHGGQLEHSITAAYGQNFDGQAYLRRFFSRRYSLKDVSLEPLVENLIKLLNIEENLLNHPDVVLGGGNQWVSLPKARLISDYLRAYGLVARDALGVMERLQIATALVGSKNVQLLYLLPLIIWEYFGTQEPKKVIKPPAWTLPFAHDEFGQDIHQYELGSVIESLHVVAQMSDRELVSELNHNNFYARIITEGGFRNNSNEYHFIQNYPNLIKSVARFS